MIKRGFKKFFYGLFYLGLFFLLGFLFYNIFLKPAPTCFDNIKNQGEEDIDCGGPCLSCAILHLKPLRANRPQFFSLANGQLGILTEIFNPNTGYVAAQFSYEINLYGRPHRLLKKITGSDFIYDLEKKYIFESDISGLAKEVIDADISLGGVVWKSNQEIVRPNLKIASHETIMTPSGIQVEGTVFNGSILPAVDLKILALLYDKFGRLLFVSPTYLSRIESLANGNFVVVFPADDFLEKNADFSKTEVFVSGRL